MRVDRGEVELVGDGDDDGLDVVEGNVVERFFKDFIIGVGERSLWERPAEALLTGGRQTLGREFFQ